MVLRLVLIITFLAASLSMVSTLFAAPPRFSGYSAPSTFSTAPDGVVTNAPMESAAKDGSGAAMAMDKARKSAAAAGQPDAKIELEFINGKLVRKKTSPKGSDKGAESKQPESMQSGPEQAAQQSATNSPAAVVASIKEGHKKRRARIFGTPIILPKEKTQKQKEELVTSDDYHESKIERLGVADVHSFRSGYQEYWKVNASKIMCSMQQNIPGYGHVEFRQGVGQPLEFALYVTYPPAGVGRAHIRTEPPEWRHFSHAKDLGVIEIEPGALAVSASKEWALRLLLELSEGMQPVMRYWDAADATDEMEVLITSLNFQESLDLFNRCLGQVLRYDFDAVKRTIVHFHADSSKLRNKAARQLDEIMEMLITDTGIKRVDLELYTHSKGLVRYNFRLATRRARAVRDYFIKRGIPEESIVIKIHTLKKSKLDTLGYKQSDVHIALKRNPAK